MKQRYKVIGVDDQFEVFDTMTQKRSVEYRLVYDQVTASRYCDSANEKWEQFETPKKKRPKVVSSEIQA